MLSDYEKLREEQLEFLDHWNQSFVIPARKKAKHDHFRVNLKEIYALRIDDIIFFANQNKMTFKYSNFLFDDAIVFEDIERR